MARYIHYILVMILHSITGIKLYPRLHMNMLYGEIYSIILIRDFSNDFTLHRGA